MRVERAAAPAGATWSSLEWSCPPGEAGVIPIDKGERVKWHSLQGAVHLVARLGNSESLHFGFFLGVWVRGWNPRPPRLCPHLSPINVRGRPPAPFFTAPGRSATRSGDELVCPSGPSQALSPGAFGVRMQMFLLHRGGGWRSGLPGTQDPAARDLGSVGPCHSHTAQSVSPALRGPGPGTRHLEVGL